MRYVVLARLYRRRRNHGTRGTFSEGTVCYAIMKHVGSGEGLV